MEHERAIEIIRALQRSPRIELRSLGDGTLRISPLCFLVKEDVDLLRELKQICDSDKVIKNTIIFSFWDPLHPIPHYSDYPVTNTP